MRTVSSYTFVLVLPPQIGQCIHKDSRPLFIIAFNACEQHGYLMEVPDTWADVHPSIATLPVEWEYEMPFGIVYAQKPSKAFMEFMKTLDSVF